MTATTRPVIRHQESVTRDTQREDTIYITPDSTTFVTPDGEGRYWYDRHTPREYGWDVDLPDGLDDEDAAVWVAQQQHGDDLPIVRLETTPND